MSEGFMRHFIAFLGSLICLLAFLAGYKAAGFGLWWTGVGVAAIYAILYTLLEV